MAKNKKPVKAADAVAPAKPITVKVTAAKGRPMLTWVGKRPLGQVQAYPAQLVERFSVAKTAEPNLLFHGDNKDVLAWLLANGYRGKVQLVYIDPPFDSGADYVRKVSLRGPKGSMKVDGESYSLGEQIQYTDIWANDNYLQFMYERLLLLRELMSDDATLCLHCDSKRSHLLRSLLDEVFGTEAFANEISRVKCNPKNSPRRAFGNIRDTVLVYVRTNLEQRVWNPLLEEKDSEDLVRLFPRVAANGRRYTTVPLHARGTRRGETGKPWKGLEPPPGRHWSNRHAELDQFEREGRIEWSDTGNPRLIRWADEDQGNRVQDIWTLKDPIEDDYPTEKPEALIERFISSSSNAGALVLDCFVGSGTTAAAAQRLGRRWIGADINKGAIQTTLKRVQSVIQEQVEATKAHSSQGTMFEVKDAPVAGPFAVDVYRVNDYDLQVQHNEAVALACEYLGVQRNRGDRFFDGTRGKQLVKITPFNHPLSPVDLDALKQELEGRLEEDRDILVVCLGLEQAARRWVDDWNALRKKTDRVNRIEVVELRSDPKYGGFLAHQPAQAKVTIARKKSQIIVSIDDFISPSIVERLRQQAGVLEPKIDDWRAMVDTVMIDAGHDGTVFNITFSDVPARKTDLVTGRYELPAPPGETTVAVKITDMLGEEVLVTRTV